MDVLLHCSSQQMFISRFQRSHVCHPLTENLFHLHNNSAVSASCGKISVKCLLMKKTAARGLRSTEDHRGLLTSCDLIGVRQSNRIRSCQSIKIRPPIYPMMNTQRSEEISIKPTPLTSSDPLPGKSLHRKSLLSVCRRRN